MMLDYLVILRNQRMMVNYEGMIVGFCAGENGICKCSMFKFLINCYTKCKHSLTKQKAIGLLKIDIASKMKKIIKYITEKKTKSYLVNLYSWFYIIN